MKNLPMEIRPKGDLDLVAKFSLEMWKLLRAFERTLDDLPDEKKQRRSSQHRYSTSRLESLLDEAGLRLLTFDGQKFTANLPVSPLNADDVGDPNDAMIESTIEPAIVGQNILIHTGKVILAGGTNVSRD